MLFAECPAGESSLARPAQERRRGQATSNFCSAGWSGWPSATSAVGASHRLGAAGCGTQRACRANPLPASLASWNGGARLYRRHQSGITGTLNGGAAIAMATRPRRRSPFPGRPTRSNQSQGPVQTDFCLGPHCRLLYAREKPQMGRVGFSLSENSKFVNA